MSAPTNTDLTETIALLHREYLWWKNDPDEDTFHYLKRTYNELLDIALRHPSQELSNVMNDYIMKMADGYVQMGEFISLGESYMLIDYFLVDAHLKFFTEKPENQHKLGWLLCDHSSMYTYQDNTIFSKKFKNLLTQITGQTFDAELKPTVDVVITALYGKASWELYGCTLNENTTEFELREVINTIVNMGIHIKTATPGPENTNSLELPDTVFI